MTERIYSRSSFELDGVDVVIIKSYLDTSGCYAKRFRLAGLILAVGFMGFAGAKETKEATKAQKKNKEIVSYKKMIQPIFNAHCVYCHISGAMQGELTLEPGLSPRSLIAVKSSESPLMRIAPGKPEDSYLVHKLEGTHLEVGGSGVSMPFSASKLKEQDLALIRRWIASGAPNN
ncbi:MAG: hypothetical protein WA112_08990 [Rugosibacter sp.]|jgi:mono/diheme cytochrome c family protein|nr:hypothetical protein [Rugosibacter sp.]